METKTHVHEEFFEASASRVFALLHTPSAIRQWWGATRAIVMPEAGGLWAAAWGPDEDAPDYMTSATMAVFDPPRRLVLSAYQYSAPSGPLPFDADFVTEFVVEPHVDGVLLRVSQAGFPCTLEGERFYNACDQGWRDTFAGIRRFLSSPPSSDDLLESA
ncbi:MAG TPA: SRPBCC domain-containing protein [Gemmatimonadales bacterium]|nr:SRPBCC domain-containing protein [Gemmatimonadales bacterium]